jgi:hypothetical protein
MERIGLVLTLCDSYTGYFMTLYLVVSVKFERICKYVTVA